MLILAICYLLINSLKNALQDSNSCLCFLSLAIQCDNERQLKLKQNKRKMVGQLKLKTAARKNIAIILVEKFYCSIA